MSPVLQAFFGGQQQQNDLMKTAQSTINMQQERQQKQQELDDVMKRFSQSESDEKDRLDNMHQLMNIHMDEANRVHRNDITNAIMGGSQGYTPPTTATAVPGAANSSSSSSSNSTPVAYQSTPNRTVAYKDIQGNPQTMQVPWPSDVDAMNNASAVSKQAALAPGNRAAKQADQDILDKSKATQMDIAQQYKEENASNLAAAAKLLQDSKNETNLEKQRGMINEGLYKIGVRKDDMTNRDWGTNDPDAIAKMVEANRAGIANGTLAPKDIPVGQRTATTNALTRNGDVVIGGDNTRLMAGVQASATNLGRLLDASDQYGKVLGTNNSKTSQLVSKAASIIPGTDTSQAASQYKSTLGGIVTAEGLSAGLARSTMGQGSATGVQITPGDTANQQEDKKLTLADVALSSIQGKIATLSKNQKNAAWAQVINNNPRIFNHAKYDSIIKELTSGSGNYNSDMVKNLYNAGGH